MWENVSATMASIIFNNVLSNLLTNKAVYHLQLTDIQVGSVSSSYTSTSSTGETKNSKHFIATLKTRTIRKTGHASQLRTNLESSPTYRSPKHWEFLIAFIYEDRNYKQVRRTPTASPILPAMANIFINSFEKKAVESSRLQPTCGLRYVNDVFVIWSLGNEKLNYLHQHPTPNIQSRGKQKKQLTAVPVRLKHEKQNRRIRPHCLQETNRSLHATSHHYPVQLNRVLTTLTHITATDR